MSDKISTVISVCCRKDLKIWEKTSHAIPQCINATSYIVIVPKSEVAVFKNITCGKIEVISENDALQSIDIYAVAAKLGSNRRAGWYYQQLLKIHALSQMNQDTINLIWDADTLPLKPIDFVTEDKKLVFYTSDEHHQPYFNHIKQSLHLDKIVATSFIAQCFVSKAAWVQSYLSELEKLNNCSWTDAILMHIDRSEACGFSEYESMGTYFTHNFMEHMHFSSAKWERFGNSKIGVKNFSPEIAQDISRTFDYISFENWDVADRMPELGSNKSVEGFFNVYFRSASDKFVIQIGTAGDIFPEGLSQNLGADTSSNLKYVLIEPSKDNCDKLQENPFYNQRITVINAICANKGCKQANSSERAISIADISYAKDNKNLLIIIANANDVMQTLNGIHWRFPPKHIVINAALPHSAAAESYLFSKGYKYICGDVYKLFLHSK